MASVTVTPRNVSADWNIGAIIRNFEAGGTVDVGDSVYIDTNGKVQVTDADAALVSARAVGFVVQTADQLGATAAASGQRVSVCVFGPVHGFSGMTPGAPVYVSETAGEVDQAAPTGSTWQYVIGIAMTADTIFVRPGLEAPYSV